MKKRLKGLISCWLAVAMLFSSVSVSFATGMDTSGACEGEHIKIIQQPALDNDFTVEILVKGESDTEWREPQTGWNQADNGKIKYAWYAYDEETESIKGESVSSYETFPDDYKLEEGVIGGKYVCRVTYIWGDDSETEVETIESNVADVVLRALGYYHTGNNALKDGDKLNPDDYEKTDNIYYGESAPTVKEQALKHIDDKNRVVLGWKLWKSYTSGAIKVQGEPIVKGIDDIASVDDIQYCEQGSSGYGNNYDYSPTVEMIWTEKYKIEPQPTNETFTVGGKEYNIDDAEYYETTDVTYQWHLWETVPYTVVNTVEDETNEIAKSYTWKLTFSEGKWLTTANSSYSEIDVAAQAGDIIDIKFDSDFSGTVRTGYSSGDYEYNTETQSYRYTVSEDKKVYAYIRPEDTSIQHTFTMTVLRNSVGESIVGETGATLTSGEDGNSYLCQLTFGQSGDTVVLYSDTVMWGEPEILHEHPICGDAECASHSSGITYTAWDGTTAFPGGNVYLSNDITLEETLEISSGTVNLCLNGHTVSSTWNSNVIYVESGNTLNICDCTGTGKITSDHSAATINVEGTASLHSGTVENKNSNGRPGIALNSGSLTVTGGTVTSSNGSGIGVYGGTLILSGAPAISGATADFHMMGNDSAAITIDGSLNNVTPYSVRFIVYDNLPSTIVSANATDYSGNFVAANSVKYGIYYDSTSQCVKLAERPSSYTVTFNANGGTCETASAETVDGKLATLPDATRVGYIFNGWFDAAEGENKITTETEFATNKTVYAQWTAYAITQQPTVDNEYEVVVNPSANVAYTWHEITEDDVTTENAGIYEDEGYSSSYTAGWWSYHSTEGMGTPGYFSIDLNAGDVVEVELSHACSATVRIYHYYYDGTVTRYQDYEDIESGSKATLVAPADAKYDLFVSVYDGVQPTVKAKVIKAGKAIDGQTTSKLTDGVDGTKYVAKITYPDGAVLTSDAVCYVSPSFDVTFDTDGGTAVSKQTVENGGKVEEPATPSKTGYTFAGWYKDSELETAWDFDTDTVTEPTTLYAKWTAKAEVIINTDVQNYTYDKSAKQFEIKGTSLTGFTVSYKQGETPVINPTNAGTYDVIITRPEDDPYKSYSKTITGGLVINKAVVNVPTVASKVYTGENQTADIPESELYTETTNEGRADVGTADVVLTLVDSTNYKWSDGTATAEKTIEFEITKANVNAITGLDIEGWTYGEDAKLPTASATFGTPNFTYVGTGETNYAENATPPANAGTYKVIAKVADTTNYAGASDEKEFAIAKATQSAPGTPAAVNETIKAKADGKITGVTSYMEYKLEGASEYIAISETEIANLAAGTYLVRYKENANHLAGADKRLVIADGAMITVTFNSNEGTAVDSKTSEYNQAITAPAEPTKENFVFAGWYKDAECLDLWNFGNTLIENITLYAKWNDKPVYSVSGKVTDGEFGLGGITVTLKQGNTIIATTTTAVDGSYSFITEDGLYNIVAEKKENDNSTIKTVKIKVTESANVNDVVFVATDINSELEIKPDTPQIIVGGLDEEAQTVSSSNGNADVTVKMTVESAEDITGSDDATGQEQRQTEQKEIKKVSGNRYIQFIEINLTQSISGAESTKLEETSGLIEIIIPFEKGNKRNITVYHYHGTVAEKLGEGVEKANADGEYFEVKENHVAIYAKKFSTYAIGYDLPSSGGSSVTRYTVKFDTNGGSTVSSATVTKNTNVTEPEVPEKKGYTFGGWYTDAEFTEKYDFESKVTKNFTLYAKWDKHDDEQSGTDTHNCPSLAFDDLNITKWYHFDTDYVIENGIFKGTTETTFEPDSAQTRAMMVTVLYRAEGEPAVNRSIPFADVDMGAYYANAVIWGQQNGIIKGYSETEFGPNDNITREQIAAIMFRYAQYKGIDVSVGEDTNILSYDDFDDISEYAIPSVQWACGSGLIKGRTESTLNPKENATRAEIAAILHRFLEEDK